MVFIYILIALLLPVAGILINHRLFRYKAINLIISFTFAMLALISQISINIEWILSKDTSALLDVAPYMMSFYYIFLGLVLGINFIYLISNKKVEVEVVKWKYLFT